MQRKLILFLTALCPLRRYSADSPSPSSSNSGSGSAAARLPRAAQPQAAAPYPNCRRRR